MHHEYMVGRVERKHNALDQTHQNKAPTKKPPQRAAFFEPEEVAKLERLAQAQHELGLRFVNGCSSSHVVAQVVRKSQLVIKA